MSISSESKSIREFWLSPLGGGREKRIELVDSDFCVADGHRVLGMYAQVKNDEPDLFAIVNLADGSAFKLSEGSGTQRHQSYATQLLGKGSNVIVWFTFLVFGLSGWAWFKNGWMLGVPALIGGLFLQQFVISKIPALRKRANDDEERRLLEKKIKERIYLCEKFLDKTLSPRWS